MRSRSPYTGLIVVEASEYEGIAYAGLILASLGATVLKVERTTGDPLRRRPPFAPATDGQAASIAFEYLNRGKQCQRVDDDTTQGREQLAELLSAADLVLADSEFADLLRIAETPRPSAQVRVVAGTYGAHPVEPSSPSTAFTRFHAATSGYLVPADRATDVRPGWTGPYAFEAMFGTAVAVAALTELRRGTGADVDFSYQAYGLWMDKMTYCRVALDPRDDAHRYTIAYPFGGNVPCRDGYACIFIIEEHQWLNLCREIGHAEWTHDSRFSNGVLRRQMKEQIDTAILKWSAELTVDEILERGAKCDFPVGRVRTMDDLLGSEDLYERQFLTRHDTGFGERTIAGLPFGRRFPGIDQPASPAARRATSLQPHGTGGQRSRRTAPDQKPLSGLKVLDLTWAAAGPIATSFMAFLGADVVKVEHRSRPDLMRAAELQYGYSVDDDLDTSPSFHEIAAGKRSIELNLKDEAQRAMAVRLAARCDVLIENMRPGAIERLGLGYEDMRRHNERLVMCSQSATGRVQGRRPPGYAPIFWAEGGGAILTGWPDRPPGVVRGPVDFHAAAYALVGVLAALALRDQTGVGSYIDCSALECVASAVGVELLEAEVLGVSRTRAGNAFPGMIFNDVVPCFGIDEWVAISAMDERELVVLAEVLGLEGPPMASPATLRPDAYTIIAQQTSLWDASRLEATLRAAGLAVSRSMSLASTLTEPRLANRGVWQTLEGDPIERQTIVGLPWTTDGRAYDVGSPGPRLGRDTETVLSEWLADTEP